MVAPDSHGAGVGRRMGEDAKTLTAAPSATVLDIGACHLSAPFFSPFGARKIGRTENGSGPNVDCVDMECAVQS